MKNWQLVVVVGLAYWLTGCASSKPIIDPKSSKNPENYYSDKMECEEIARNVPYGSEMAKSAFWNSILSAIMGAALAGNNVSASTGAAAGAVSGAVVGAGKGAWDVSERREKIMLKCLTGRGYSVLE
jgi:hypothetical protein